MKMRNGLNAINNKRSRLKKASQRFSGLFLAAALLLSGAALAGTQEETAQAADTTDAKYINVVYDDSQSMLNSDKWCQAKYAMEVFSTMISDEDTLNIFQMNGETESVSGDAQERANTIHEMETGSGGTPYSKVKEAYKDLVNNGGDAEQWLFVITDGGFRSDDNNDTISTEVVQADFEQYAEEGINVIYLAIGKGAPEYEADTDNGLYCYKASSSEDILSEMTAISNLISARLDLGADEDYYNEHVTETEDGLEIELDVPMSEIIIFAQGDQDTDVSIGDMTSDVCKISASSEVEVTSCDPTEEMQSNSKKHNLENANLSGVVKTFTGKNGATMSAGTYTVKVTGADAEDIKIYYTPQVEAALTVTQDGEEVAEGDYLEPGEVQLEAYLVDPDTGERIESDLLKNIGITYEVTNGEETQTLEDEEDTFTAKAGDITVKATVSVEDSGIQETAEFSAGVKQILDDLTVEAASEVTFKKSELADHGGTFQVTVRENGELLSEEDWNDTDLVIGKDKEDSCLEFSCARGEDVSTYVVTVSYDEKADERTAWKNETVQCSIRAEMNTDGKEGVSEPAETTVTAKRLSDLEILGKYWKKILALLIIIIIVLGYIPPIKKRFPRSLKKKLAGREVPVSGIGKTVNYNGSFKKKFSTVILPYVREKGTLRYLKPGVTGSKMQLRAVNRSSMEITNASKFAGKDFKFDGEKIEPGTKKYKISAHTSIRAEVNGKRYTCQL